MAVVAFRWVYAAKFVCGEMKPQDPKREQPVEAGRYATAINIHNPNPVPVGFLKKAVLLFDASHPPEVLEQVVQPRRPITRELGPDAGLEIDCRDIREVLLRVPGTP